MKQNYLLRSLHFGQGIEHVWGTEEVHTEFWWRNLREGDHLENPGVVWKIILKCICETWNRGMNWIDLAQVRDRWLLL
jgi:hypothetical protein